MADINKLRRYIDNIYTQEEALDTLEHIKDPECQEAVNQVADEVWKESCDAYPISDYSCVEYKKEAQLLINHLEHQRSIWFRRLSIAAVSAAAVILLCVGGIQFYQKMQLQVPYASVSTSFGEKKRVTLPDGSLLILNSCSRIYYPIRFTGDVRKIMLNGEAFFKVVHNEKLPFVVKTNHFNVRVLGTQFDVKAYSSDELASVGVKSGKVQVNLPEAMMKIRSKEEISINIVSGEYTKRVRQNGTDLWVEGSTLRFNCTPIRDAARELERIYNCRITFAFGQKFDNLISGEHDNLNLKAVLSSIEFVTGIHYKIKGNHVFLYHD